jgi:WD40 repeat protein
LSYSHDDNRVEDRRWATWLQREIEHFEVPSELVGTINRRGQKIPNRIYPVFRDEESLAADAKLGARIESALRRSYVLLVLCSPTSANSAYVDEEVRFFQKLTDGDNIICALIAGRPAGSLNECFPETLRVSEIQRSGFSAVPPLAADFRLLDGSEGFTSAAAYRQYLIRDGTFDRHKIESAVANYERRCQLAKLKLLAGVLGIDLEILRNRDQAYQLAIANRKAKLQRRLITVFAILFASALLAAWVAIGQRNSALTGQSLLLAQRARELVASNPELAKKIALTALPARKGILQRPFVKEAELALFGSCVSTIHGRQFDHGKGEEIAQYFMTPDAKRLVLAGDTLSLWNVTTGELISRFRPHPSKVFNQAVTISKDGQFLLFAEMPIGRGLVIELDDKIVEDHAQLWIANVSDGTIVGAFEIPDMWAAIGYADQKSICLYSKNNVYWYSLDFRNGKPVITLQEHVSLKGFLEAYLPFFLFPEKVVYNQPTESIYLRAEEDGKPQDWWKVSRRSARPEKVPVGTEHVKDFSVSEDGSYLMVCDRDGNIRLMDSQTFAVRSAPPGSSLPHDVVAASFLPSKNQFYIVSRAGEIRTYDTSLALESGINVTLPSSSKLSPLNDGWVSFVTPHISEICQMAGTRRTLPMPPFKEGVDPVIKHVNDVWWALYVAPDGIARFTNVERPTSRLHRLRSDEAVSASAFCPVRKLVYTGTKDGAIAAMDVQNEKVVWGKKNNSSAKVTNVSVDETGEVIVVSFDDGNVIVFDAQGNVLKSHKFEFGSVDLSRINVARGDTHILSMQDNMPCVYWTLQGNQAIVWQRPEKEGSLIWMLRMRSMGCKAEFFPRASPSYIFLCRFGDGLVAAAPPAVLSLKDRTLLSLGGVEGAILDFSISKGGDRCAAGGYARMVTMWDLRSFKIVWELRVHTHSVVAVRLSDDGVQGASLDTGGHLIVWRVKDGVVVCEMDLGAKEFAYSSFDFHPTQPIIATARGSEIAFWDYRTGTKLGSRSVEGFCRAPQFSDDGKVFYFYSDLHLEDASSPTFYQLSLPPSGYGMMEAVRQELGLSDIPALSDRQKRSLSIQ